jgi:hypothetical protein
MMYLGYFDDTKRKPVEDKLQEASARYFERYARRPTIALLSERDATELKDRVEGLTLRVVEYVRPNNYLLGEE